MIYSNDRGSVIEAQSEFLAQYPFIFKHIRVINYRFPSFCVGDHFSSGAINHEANKREDDLNDLLNKQEFIKAVDRCIYQLNQITSEAELHKIRRSWDVDYGVFVKRLEVRIRDRFIPLISNV